MLVVLRDGLAPHHDGRMGAVHVGVEDAEPFFPGDRPPSRFSSLRSASTGGASWMLPSVGHGCPAGAQNAAPARVQR